MMGDGAAQGELFGDTGGIGERIGAVERWCRRRGIDWIIGVDEAGRGPLAGPVHAGAVGLRTDRLDAEWIDLLDDSKELEPAARERAFEHVRTEAPAAAIATASSDAIDRANILEAARDAMRRAARDVRASLESEVDCLFVDGDQPIDASGAQQTVVGGDGRSFAIAAASILAKVSRDRRMVEYGDEWPAYGFASNKGYPTPDHRRALERVGPSPIHRYSFSGVDTDDT